MPPGGGQHLSEHAPFGVETEGGCSCHVPAERGDRGLAGETC